VERQIIDEVRYLTYDNDAANMLCHVVNYRHRRRRSIILTTNKPLATWGRVLHDEDLAQAIVDRVLERGRLLILDGHSMRTKHLGFGHRLTRGIKSGGQRQCQNFRNSSARVSGTYTSSSVEHGREANPDA